MKQTMKQTKAAVAHMALMALMAGASPALMAATPEASGPATTAQAPLPEVEGEIRKVDAEAGKLTIRHGPIGNLEMGAMTMIFRVKDPAMLTQVQAGDKVRFTVDRIDGLLTVTSLAVGQ
ncbi:copper-binding protein [Cupriavidus sp. D384]|uniref:copper-binding protein n=1 Tax=Cupriavidus sp. D384 TaxID=1538095 RepID=UPI000B1E4190|nr:copper-binding protein [Cupriavidus sp. D384]